MAKEYIAFRTCDIDGDSWCETAFLFQTEDEAKSFFRSDNKEFVKNFVDYEDTNVPNDVTDFKVFYTPSDNISAIKFHTIYAGEVLIKRMAEGYVINPTETNK